MERILIIAEHANTILADSTRATISAAATLGSPIDVLLASDNDALVKTLCALDKVTCIKTIEHPRFSTILAEDIAPIIVSLAPAYSHILAPATTFGKNILPRVAALLDVAQISEVSKIESADIFIRPIYAGNAFEKVRSHDNIKVLTIRVSAFDNVSTTNTLAPHEKLTLPVTPFENVEYKGSHSRDTTRPELTSASIVISGGRGLKNAENFNLLYALADKLHAAVGATRAAVDAGFVPNDYQVGQTGKVVAPQLYIAIGISGAVQHLAGMKESKIIVAINKDPDAPIFQIANYGLVGDLFAELPALIAALEN